jgi:BlaI family penicillinase repressor
METKELTKVELQLMNVLWDMGNGFVNDILDKMSEPKPAYNTVSTFMRILVNKGFVGYEAMGKSHRYYPLISRKEYVEEYMNGVKNTFFKGSLKSMLSFFAQHEKLSTSEVDSIIEILNSTKSKES